MIHARKDYNRIQDPAIDDPSLLGEGCSPIAKGEPVFLLRANDEHFIGALHDYKARLLKAGMSSRSEMVTTVQAHIERAVAWEASHGTKAPDMPTLREGE